MKVSYNWLQSFFEKQLPPVKEVAEKITFGAFEIESIEKEGEDVMIDVDVLPNRGSDCLCHRGIAHEISVLTGIKMKTDPLSQPPKLPKEISGDELSVHVDDEKRCPYYGAALIRGVQVGPSPDWLKERLEAIGQKSINNIVDATNYVMFELGTPLHAFDADKLKNDKGIVIGVRAAKKGEEITTLGGDENKLDPEMTVIVDGNSDAPIAIAGVKGGMVAEVTNETVSVVLEAAKFDPVRTRKTAQALSLRTDASKRFENEIADELPQYGLARAAELIQEIAEGKCAGIAQSSEPRKGRYKTGVSTDEINHLLGTSLTDKEVSNIFDKLNFVYEKIDEPATRAVNIAKTLEGKPYKYGASVVRDAPEAFDCSSFVAYVFAQVGISVPRVAIDQYVYSEPIEEKDLRPGDIIFSNGNAGKEEVKFTRVSDGVLTSNTPSKDVTIDFLPGTKVEHAVGHNGIFIGDGLVVHAAGNNSGFSRVVIEKVSESTSFKNIVGYRHFSGSDFARFVVSVPFERLDVRLPADLIEEIGRVYGYGNIESVALPPAKEKPRVLSVHYWAERIRGTLLGLGYDEVLTSSLHAEGEVGLANAFASDKSHLRSNLADGITEKLDLNERHAPLLGIYDAVRVFEIGTVFSKKGEYIHACIGVRPLVKKKRGEKAREELDNAREAIQQALGVELSGEALERSDEETIEFSLSALLGELPQLSGSYEELPTIKKGTNFHPFSIYPFVLRDIALWAPEGTEKDTIMDIINQHASDLLVRCDLFDEFHGKDGRVSYAFHLVFQADDRTLSDDEVNQIMKAVESELVAYNFEAR